MATTSVVVEVKTRGQSDLERLHRSTVSAEQSFGKLQGQLGKTGREFKTAANGMRYYIDAMGKARKENGQFVSTAEAAAAGIRKTGSAASAASGGVNKLAGAVKGLVSAYAILQGAKFVFAKTAELETQTRSLQVLTGSLEEAQGVIEDLQKFASVTPFTSSELIETAKRLKAFGVDTEKLVDTTKRLGDVAGATGAELSGIATAYGQIQAKGRLQGEELLQLQERGVDLQGELQEMYKLTGEEFKDALEKGKISAEAVEVALQRLTDTGGKYADGAIAQSDTLAGKFSTLQDGIDQLARQIGAVLTPAIQAVLSQAIQAINTINNLLGAGARAQQFGLNQQARTGILRQAQGEAEQIVNTRRIKDPFERNRVFQEIASQREKDLIEAYGYKTGQIKAEAKVPTVGAAPIPALGGGRAGSGGGGKGKGKGGAGATRESQVPALERELQLKKDLFALEQKVAEAKAVDDKSSVIRLQGEQKLLELKSKIAAVEADSKLPAAEKALKTAILEQEAAEARFDTANKLETLEANRKERLDEMLTGFDREIELANTKGEEAKKLLEIEHKILDLKKEGLLTTEAEVEAYRARAQAAAQAGGGKGKIQDYMSKLETELADTEGMIVSLAQTVEGEIGSAMSNAITGLIDGTQTAEQAFSQMFKNIGKAFIDMATQMIAKALIMKALGILTGGLGGGGGGGGFGSTDSRGYSFGSLVDAFADGGYVTGPTNALIGEAGQPEYVIPASKMDGAMSRWNQGARGSAVIDGPGGEPGSSQGSGVNLSMSFETTKFMDREWVDREQLQMAMAQAAVQGGKQGEARALAKLRNSPGARRKIGL